MLEDISFKGEYYDPDFFAFMDDTDLSIRSLLCGWSTRYNPTAVGRHVRGGSSSKLADFVYYLCLRNERLFYYKTFKADLNKFDPARSALDLVRKFTVPAAVREKAEAGFRELYPAAMERRKAFEGKHDFRNLEPFLLGSRVIFSAKEKIMRGFQTPH
ncbi:MAG: hypothetical protein EOP04_33165 [Proteobacteria bacterium]|nr:MAG: hypothetical protein EOP04_33165 [Pseudomonadota bacterium]